MDWHGIVADCALLSPRARAAIAAVWVPLRHLGWAASLNAASLAVSSSNRLFFAQSAELSVLHLQRARFLSALGWALGGAGALRSARRAWLEDRAWQALRRYAEDSLALRDPVECSLVWTLMLNGVLWPLLDSRALRRCVGDEAGTLPRYLDALFEPRAVKLPALLRAPIEQWAPRAASAALPVIERVWGADADEKLGAAMERLAAWTTWDGPATGMQST